VNSTQLNILRHPTGITTIDRYDKVHCRIDLFLIVLDGKFLVDRRSNLNSLAFLFEYHSSKFYYYIQVNDYCTMSIIGLILERWRYQQNEVKTEIVVDSFLIPVGCLVDTDWDNFFKRETVLVHTIHVLVFFNAYYEY
jgi:hypothetical protein